MEGMAERLAKARSDLEATREAVARAEQELKAASVTVASRDRSVEVTVGPQGELTQLKFLDGKYRTMGAAQLAATVLDAANQGRAQMAYRVMAAFEPLATRDTADAPSRQTHMDWEKIFGPLLSAAAYGNGRGAASDRLRDEIHEDPEHG
ncbi:YbaB/EbfC family nucleoid-associated protein [Streptomyces sp.]|uniref:YbaB/EbfC family nucleoid-associated protein n=1 Tax=Streptomyces sp. TaxID=1931 RepID=UPI002F42526A